jgi:hypothetical protein
MRLQSQRYHAADCIDSTAFSGCGSFWAGCDDSSDYANRSVPINESDYSLLRLLAHLATRAAARDRNKV